jgi:iron complex outermembrane receptor protein
MSIKRFIWHGLLVISSVTATLGAVPWVAAAADTSADQGAQLEEIIVTAQKREENLQNVPISAQVIGSQALAVQNHNSLEELTETVPDVHVSTGAWANNLFIRGIGSGQNPSFDQSVATFVDDVYMGRSRMIGASFLDVERIEVLKGPQSTFFGNNAIAGALSIVTKKPGDTFDVSARALYGMYGQYVRTICRGGCCHLAVQWAAIRSNSRDVQRRERLD